jgi:ATP/maltotriose-dependent transcriptional regulator MalT
VEDVCRRVCHELESAHDPEVAAATANSPEQLRILLRAGVHDLSVGGGVTLVCAPVGYGKTVLLAEWARRGPLPPRPG